jgi:hypothetical protein
LLNPKQLFAFRDSIYAIVCLALLSLPKYS